MLPVFGLRKYNVRSFYLMCASFQVTNAVGESAIESVDFVLRPRVKWYHLVLTHSAGTTFGAESQLKIYIDSKLRFHQVFNRISI